MTERIHQPRTQSYLEKENALFLGESGPALAELQARVNVWARLQNERGDAELPVLKITGHYDDTTKFVARAFQNAHGVDAHWSGTMGPETRDALLEYTPGCEGASRVRATVEKSPSLLRSQYFSVSAEKIMCANSRLD